MSDREKLLLRQQIQEAWPWIQDRLLHRSASPHIYDLEQRQKMEAWLERNGKKEMRTENCYAPLHAGLAEKWTETEAENERLREALERLKRQLSEAEEDAKDFWQEIDKLKSENEHLQQQIQEAWPIVEVAFHRCSLGSDWPARACRWMERNPEVKS